MQENIILTTGVYDLIKDHLRRKKVTKAQEEILLKELKHAKQVLRRDLPKTIVNVDKVVEVKDSLSNTVKTFTFVGPEKAKPKKNKFSILSDVGVAIVGYQEGETIKWPTEDGDVAYEIVSVKDLVTA